MTKAHILIVEDDRIVAEGIQNNLKSLGFAVSAIVSYGEEAINKVKENNHDLVLMDIVLKGEMDGIEAAGQIRSQFNIPVVYLTAYSDERLLDRAKLTEPFGYIFEPFEKAELRSAIEIALYKDKMEKELKKHRDHLEELVEERTSKLKESSEELRKQRSRLEAIFASVKDAIITVDNELRVIAANKTTKNICGMAPKDIIGKEFDCLNRCNKSCHEVLRGTLKRKNTVKEYQVECRRHARPKQTVVLTSSPLLDQDGRFMGAVLVIRDITRISDLERELRERHKFRSIIGKGRKMQDIYGLIEDLADLETTVLVTGESGTGKELVARALHYRGSRAFKPMVTVNCSALAENLLESEMFGHVKGAFTGAIRDKQGRFQAAHEGTILLDEIGDISPRIQLKLMRVLQEKEFERVGESTPIKVDVRVIACTNQDLIEKVRKGEFREDFYYRLKVVKIVLPPLRERLEDIPLLVDHFINVFNKSFKKNIKGLSANVLRTFMSYAWPGNIRELEHAMERAFVFCRGRTIKPEHIPSEVRGYSTQKRPALVKAPARGPEGILDALNKAGWNKAKAARLLDINRRTLYKKIETYKLSEPAESTTPPFRAGLEKRK